LKTSFTVPVSFPQRLAGALADRGGILLALSDAGDNRFVNEEKHDKNQQASFRCADPFSNSQLTKYSGFACALFFLIRQKFWSFPGKIKFCREIPRNGYGYGYARAFLFFRSSDLRIHVSPSIQ
jgi:hypothetical protein